MYVVKRDGHREPVQFDKINARLQNLSFGLNAEHCDPLLVERKVCAGVYNGVTTAQLDELAAETAASMATNHPHYALLAARVSVSNLHKNTKESLSERIRVMYNHFDKRSGKKAPLIADEVYEIIMKVADQVYVVFCHFQEPLRVLTVNKATDKQILFDAPRQQNMHAVDKANVESALPYLHPYDKVVFSPSIRQMFFRVKKCNSIIV